MYCINCGKKIKNKNTTVCPHCNAAVANGELSYEETRTFNKALHSRLNISREHFDSGMVFVVLGATFLIIGLIFFSLSYKVPDDPDTIGKVLKFTCFEFWVSAAGLGVGGIMFIIGLIRVILEKFVIQREITHTLNEVQQKRFKN